MILSLPIGQQFQLPATKGIASYSEVEGVLGGKYRFVASASPFADNDFIEGNFDRCEVDYDERRNLSVVHLYMDGINDRLFIPRRFDEKEAQSFLEHESRNRLLNDYLITYAEIENAKGLCEEVGNKLVAPLYLFLESNYGRFYNAGWIHPSDSIHRIEDEEGISVVYTGTLWSPLDQPYDRSGNGCAILIQKDRIADIRLMFQKVSIEMASRDHND